MMSSRNHRLVRDAVRTTSPRSVRTMAALGAAAAALVLSGCASSPDSHYYTLTSGTTNTFAERQANGIPSSGAGMDGDAGSATSTTATDENGGGTAATSATGRPLLIEVMPVNVPNQVSRPQIVTTSGKGSVDIDDYNRWSSPLGDEIGTALSQILSRRLGAIDTYRTPRPTGATAYRITVNVQRFESIRGDRATIDAVWSVVRSSDSLTLTCRGSATEKIGASLDDLAAGHRKALNRVAAQIAQGVRMERGVPVQPDSDTVSASGKNKAQNGANGTNGAIAPAAVPPMLSCPGAV